MDEADIIELLQLWVHAKTAKWESASTFLQDVVDDAIDRLQPAQASPVAQAAS